MITLFDNYKHVENVSEISSKLLNKLYKFLLKINEENSVFLFKYKGVFSTLTIENEYADKIEKVDISEKLFGFKVSELISLSDKGDIYVFEFSCYSKTYKILELYLFNTISPHFNSSNFSEEEQHNSIICIDDITNEIVDNIEFNVDDYQGLKDAERFGL